MYGKGCARLCLSTLGCTERRLNEVLDLAALHGLDAVELRGLGGTLDLRSHFEASFGTPDRLADLLRGSPVAVVALDADAAVIGAGAAERRELAALLPWARAAGAPYIRVFDGGETGSEAELDSIGPTLAWWAEQAPATGDPHLMIETHDALSRPAALQRCRDLFPSAMILWDSHHTWFDGGETPGVTWARVRGACPHVHVKDSRSEAALAHVAPGQGDFPAADLVGALVAARFDGVVSLEWERHWVPGLPPIEEALPGFLATYGRLARPMPLVRRRA